MKIVFATGNAHKMGEIRQILSDPSFTIVSMKEEGILLDIEETGTTFEENALIKARAVAARTKDVVLADDSGLEIDALDKAPGVYSSRFMGEDTSYTEKNAALIEKLKDVPEKDRTARFVCAVAAVFPDGTEKVVRETFEGRIAYEPEGENGFGYDPIFYVPECGCTSAVLSPEKKNELSHRGKALRSMKKILQEKSAAQKKTIKKDKKKIPKWPFVLGIIAAILIILFLWARSCVSRATEMMSQMMNAVETAEVQKRSIVSTVSATGAVEALETEKVTAALSGAKIEEVFVEVGDEVKQGDPILAFESKDYEKEVTLAENTQEEAQVKNSRSVREAEEAVRDARADYDREIPNLQGAVDRTQHDWEVAHAELIRAQNDLATAQAEGKSAEEIDKYYQKMLSAETSANNAYAAYDNAMDDLERQKTKLAEAIETAEYSLKMAKMAVDHDTTADSVETAEEKVEDTVVYAPISGTVTELGVRAGELYGGASDIAKIEDCSAYQVAAKVDEYDIGKVKEGQEVVIKTNATGDTEIKGHVKEIALHSAASESTAMAASSTEVQYKVTISLDEQVDILRPDMTAKCSIILEKKEDVLSVPYEAVQKEDDGRTYVEVTEKQEMPDLEALRQGAKQLSPEELTGEADRRKVYVETGIESDYYIEVLSDELSEGMYVVVPASDEDLQDAMMMMMRGGPMEGM